MVQKGRRQRYAIGIVRKEDLLFKDLCAMYFKTYSIIYNIC